MRIRKQLESITGRRRTCLKRNGRFQTFLSVDLRTCGAWREKRTDRREKRQLGIQDISLEDRRASTRPFNTILLQAPVEGALECACTEPVQDCKKKKRRI